MILEALYTYPIKSTHRVSQLKALVKPWGLEGDRRWMVVDSDGKFITQREFPQLSLVQAVPQHNGRLLLCAPGCPTIIVHTPDETANELDVIVWNDRVPARLASEMINSWLTKFLKHPTQLVYMYDSQSRFANPKYTQSVTPVSFADGYPILCTTRASLQELNRKMHERLPMARFRPNLVVTGDKPFGEDRWKRIQIGEVIFSVVKPCKRCVITTIDQDTGLQGKEPLRTLSKFRKRGSNVFFGENFVPENSGTIIRGDSVDIIELKSDESVTL